jgi:hypothetical protein
MALTVFGWTIKAFYAMHLVKTIFDVQYLQLAETLPLGAHYEPDTAFALVAHMHLVEGGWDLGLGHQTPLP